VNYYIWTTIAGLKLEREAEEMELEKIREMD